MENTDIIARIKSAYGSFSKGQKKIADFVLNSYDKAAFMTAQKLASVVSTSESTVVRFASEVGCDGYAIFQKELRDIIRNKLTSVQRMEVATSRIGTGDILTNVMNSDLENIKMTIEDINKEIFEKAVDAIIEAKKIYILGVRSSAALASFVGFYFNLIFDNICLVHTTSVSEMFEQIMRTGPGDVVLGISFPRYSKRTVKAVEYAATRGSTIISITDSLSAPITKHATYNLIARSDMASFVDSLVAPLSLINALIVSLAMRKKKDMYETLEHLEHIWEEYNVYEKYDDE